MQNVIELVRQARDRRVLPVKLPLNEVKVGVVSCVSSQPEKLTCFAACLHFQDLLAIGNILGRHCASGVVRQKRSQRRNAHARNKFDADREFEARFTDDK